MGHSTFNRQDKYLSFLTFLKDTDQIMFKLYEGVPPIVWKDDEMYFLKACQQVRRHKILGDRINSRVWL